MNNQATNSSRVVGLDAHPDSFTAAIIRGQTPAGAIVEKVFNRIPMRQLARWAAKYLEAHDQVVLEASGNSFEVVRTLKAVDRRALVLESAHLGKLKEAHANNDKISAVRIGKAFLAGTAKEVWVPDTLTQERRDWHHTYTKCVRRTTQVHLSIGSYLSDNGVRIAQGLPSCPSVRRLLLKHAKTWTARQWQVLEGKLLELNHAEQQRDHWSSLMAQEVLQDPLLLSMTRLCGIRDVIAFSIGAIIGDIHRFAGPKKLVAYLGLNPAFDDSGKGTWQGGIGGHGRRDLRGLLIEAAQSILRSDHPLAKWGKRLIARKSSMKLAVAAVARRLAVAIWYLMMGRWTALEEVDTRLKVKIGKIITKVGEQGLERLKKTRRQLREDTIQALKTGRMYALEKGKQFQRTATDNPTTLAEEYGLA